MYKLCFFVPPSHVEHVKAAVFAAGGGKVGGYEHCSWQVLGQGQFRPMNGSTPFIGTIGALETVTEWRVELVVVDECVEAVIAALKQSHPYETPAYDLWRLHDL
ncbi:MULTISPECIES: YqfO family protein [Pseudomonas]|uniref:NGG1p interacting factor NIF3 n=1 Tax=Pseudomonas quercus TaxID=2722792 RepID=A0ABX0YFQ2_9PSED|nr:MULTISPECIES: YqfO family protein [Pseudomonas]MBF7143136.1 YqfO family protein [Pseudomonas sp. LY10J]NJP01836.1 NGG1p interacting factor NIF3 [Pseudomonas quercus]